MRVCFPFYFYSNVAERLWTEKHIHVSLSALSREFVKLIKHLSLLRLLSQEDMRLFNSRR
jgi:hypothetical protein